MQLSACGGSSSSQTGTDLFTLNALAGGYQLVEGDQGGINIPLGITRQEGYISEVTVSIEGVTDNDETFVTAQFDRTSLTPSADNATVNLRLDVGALPLQPQQRRFRLIAADGVAVNIVTIDVEVVPVDAPDVYLLLGQSNMVGFSGDGTKAAGLGQPDEPNDRVLQLNVTRNNVTDAFITAADFSDPSRNAVEPYIVRAEDPLHVPLDPNTQSKEENYIGLGLSFAKEALGNTSRSIVLVPAAWSGTSFCRSSLLAANWNADPSDDASLGNTLLFDRALTRANLALERTGGILRGILWHQGETDADAAYPACAELYQQNLQRLAAALRERIRPDARGASARTATANVPLVVGTMSRGIDERGDFSEYSVEKQIVDNVHRSIESLIPHAAVSIHDDLTPANGYPCGNTSCIHFGAEAFREMGPRYYDALLRAVANP